MDKRDIIIPSLAAAAFALLIGAVLCTLCGPMAPARCCLILSIAAFAGLGVIVFRRREPT